MGHRFHCWLVTRYIKIEPERTRITNILRISRKYCLARKYIIITFKKNYIFHTLLVIWILGRVYGLIFPVKVYILPSRQARENIHFDREYESIYPAKNPYNEYVLLQSDQFENWTIKELEGQDSWGKKESWVKKILIYYVQHLSGISVNNLKEQLIVFIS